MVLQTLFSLKEVGTDTKSPSREGKGGLYGAGDGAEPEGREISEKNSSPPPEGTIILTFIHMNEGGRAHISRQGRVTRPIFENHGSGKGKGGRTRVNKLHLEHVRSRYALLPPGQEGRNSIRRLCGTQKPLGARRGEGEFFTSQDVRSIKGGRTFLNYVQGDAKDRGFSPPP